MVVRRGLYRKERTVIVGKFVRHSSATKQLVRKTLDFDALVETSPNQTECSAVIKAMLLVALLCVLFCALIALAFYVVPNRNVKN